MKPKITWLALAALTAGALAVSAQEERPQRPERGPRQLPPDVIKEFDKDGDGKLNEEEGRAAHEALRTRREEALKKLTAEFDKDGDGELNEDERKAMREAMEARRKALLEKYDENKNGRLDPEEIRKARQAGEEIAPPGLFQRGQRGGGPRGEGRPPRGGRGQRPAPPAGE